MAMMGFTLDKLREMRQTEGFVPDPKNDPNVEEADALLEWFKEEHFGGGFVASYKFEIEGVKFVVRGCSHEKKDYDKYLIVGIDLGKIDNFEGSLSNKGRSKEDLCLLIKQEKWINLIRECEDINAVNYSKVEYGVDSSKYEKFSIAPETHITTDDCPCCS